MPRFVGVYLSEGQAADIAFEGIYPFLFSGERKPGIITSDGDNLSGFKPGQPRVHDIPLVYGRDSFPGRIAVAQAYYEGEPRPYVTYEVPSFNNSNAIISFSGIASNLEEVKSELEDQGSLFSERGNLLPSEIIGHLVARNGNSGSYQRMKKAVNSLTGPYNAIFVLGDEMFVYRDPEGTSPLCMAQSGSDYFFAPETSAISKVNSIIDPNKSFKYTRDVMPGELISVSSDGLKSSVVSEADRSQCIRYLVFYALNESSIFDGEDVWRYRNQTGRNLALENTSIWKDIDLLCLEDRAQEATRGFLKKSGIDSDIVFDTNPYVGKIQDTVKGVQRETELRRKYNVISGRVRGRNVAFLTDSLREGIEACVKGKLLRESGAEKVTMLVASPPTARKCNKSRRFDIMDEDVGEQLSILRASGIDDVRFLSSKGMMSPLKDPGDYCTQCYDKLFSQDI